MTANANLETIENKSKNLGSDILKSAVKKIHPNGQMNSEKQKVLLQYLEKNLQEFAIELNFLDEPTKKDFIDSLATKLTTPREFTKVPFLSKSKKIHHEQKRIHIQFGDGAEIRMKFAVEYALKETVKDRLEEQRKIDPLQSKSETQVLERLHKDLKHPYKKVQDREQRLGELIQLSGKKINQHTDVMPELPQSGPNPHQLVSIETKESASKPVKQQAQELDVMSSTQKESTQSVKPNIVNNIDIDGLNLLNEIDKEENAPWIQELNELTTWNIRPEQRTEITAEEIINQIRNKTWNIDEQTLSLSDKEINQQPNVIGGLPQSEPNPETKESAPMLMEQQAQKLGITGIQRETSPSVKPNIASNIDIDGLNLLNEIDDMVNNLDEINKTQNKTPILEKGIRETDVERSQNQPITSNITEPLPEKQQVGLISEKEIKESSEKMGAQHLDNYLSNIKEFSLSDFEEPIEDIDIIVPKIENVFDLSCSINESAANDIVNQVQNLLQEEEKYKGKSFSIQVRRHLETVVEPFLESQNYVKEGGRYFLGKGTGEGKHSPQIDLAIIVKDWLLQKRIINVSSPESSKINAIDEGATKIAVPEMKSMIRSVSQRKVTDFANKPLIKPTEEQVENKLRNVVEDSILTSGKKFSRRATGALADKVLQSYKSEKNMSAYLSDSEKKRIKTSLDNTLEKAPSKRKITADKIKEFMLPGVPQKLKDFSGVEVKSQRIENTLHDVVKESISDAGKKFSRRATLALTQKVLESFKLPASLSSDKKELIKTALSNTLEKAPKGKVTADKSAFIKEFTLPGTETLQDSGVEDQSKFLPEKLWNEYKNKELTIEQLGTKVAGACYKHVSAMPDFDIISKLADEFQQHGGSRRKVAEFTTAVQKALGSVPEEKPKLEENRSKSVSNLKIGEKNLVNEDTNVRRSTSLSNIKLQGIDHDLTDIAKVLKKAHMTEDKTPPTFEGQVDNGQTWSQKLKTGKKEEDKSLLSSKSPDTPELKADNKNSHKEEPQASKTSLWLKKFFGKKDESKKSLLSNSEQKANVRG